MLSDSRAQDWESPTLCHMATYNEGIPAHFFLLIGSDF
jgi:hypothetical protein